MIDHNSSLNSKTSGSGYPPLSASLVWQGVAGRISPASVSTKKVKLTNISRYMLGLAQATRKQKLVLFYVFLPIVQGGQPSVFGPGIAGQITPAGGQVRVPPSYSRVQALLGRLVPLEKIKASFESTLTANFMNLKTNLTFLNPFSILYTKHINKNEKRK